jgi:hypothetical protein
MFKLQLINYDSLSVSQNRHTQKSLDIPQVLNWLKYDWTCYMKCVDFKKKKKKRVVNKYEILQTNRIYGK